MIAGFLIWIFFRQFVPGVDLQFAVIEAIGGEFLDFHIEEIAVHDARHASVGNYEDVFIRVLFLHFVEERIHACTDIEIAFPIGIALEEAPSLGEIGLSASGSALEIAIEFLDYPCIGLDGERMVSIDYFRGLSGPC